MITRSHTGDQHEFAITRRVSPSYLRIPPIVAAAGVCAGNRHDAGETFPTQLPAGPAGWKMRRILGKKEMINIIEKKTALRARPRLASITDDQALSAA